MAECIRKINIGTSAQRHGVIMVTLSGVLAHLYESMESYCCHFDVGVGIGIGVTLQSFTSKFTVAFFLNFHISTTIGQTHLEFEI